MSLRIPESNGPSRREFLKAAGAVTAAVASGSVYGAADAADSEPSFRSAKAPALVDTNVYLSQWPGRRLPLDETPKLIAKLRREGVTEAWAGSFDALLQKDLAAVNARLAEECQRQGRALLRPFGSVNPMLPDWEEDLRRCHEIHKMPGIRLHPNYHGYQLTDPAFAKLLDLATARGLLVQLAATMEDERTQHRLMHAPPVDLAPLAEQLKSRPALRLLLLNWPRGTNPTATKSLAGAGQVCFDIATVEGVGGVQNLLAQLPANRVVFGSYTPFYYFDSAALKLKESSLSEADMLGVRSTSALRLLS